MFFQLVLAALFFIGIQAGHSQTTVGEIQMNITPLDNGAPLPGVSIKLYQDTILLLDTRTVRPDGWVEAAETAALHLKRNSKYSLVLTKEAYIKLVITIDTHLPPDISSGKTFLTQADIKMLKADKYPNLQDSDFPLVLLQYDKEAKKFLPSKTYVANIRAMLVK